MNLDSHCEMLLQQFRELRPTLEQLADKAYNLLRQAHPDCEITMPEGLQYGCDYYTIIVSTKDMKSSIKIGIHGNDTGHVILDPEEMVF